MKNIYKYMLVAAASLLASAACTKLEPEVTPGDVAPEANAITISTEMKRNPLGQSYNAFVFKLGEEVVIPAKYTINNPDLKETDLTIEWYLGAEVVGTGAEVNLGTFPAGRYSGIIVITDTTTGLKYMDEFNFQVDDAYAEGIAIITDDGSASHLGYMRVDPNTGEWTYEEDIFAKANNGETFPSGVTSLTHHMYDTYPQTFALSIAAPGYTNEVNVHNMASLGNFNKEFATDANVSFDAVLPMYGDKYFVAAKTAEGDFYIRTDKTSGGNVVPHASFFPSRPVSLDNGEKLKITHWAPSTNVSSFIADIDYFVAYDEAGSRCVLISGPKVVPFEEYFFANSFEPNRGVYPDPFDLSDYKVLSLNAGGLDTNWMAFDKFSSIVMILEHKTSGKQYLYAFNFWNTYGSIDVDLTMFEELPSGVKVDAAKVLTANTLGGPANVTYFTANGNKDLYYVNGNYGTYGKVYSSSAAITGIGMGEIQNTMAALWIEDYTPYFEKMVIGTEDGMINVVTMDEFVRMTGETSVVYSVKSTLGNATKVAYLPNVSTSY